jgi:hypothetical protein
MGAFSVPDALCKFFCAVVDDTNKKEYARKYLTD